MIPEGDGSGSLAVTIAGEPRAWVTIEDVWLRLDAAVTWLTLDGMLKKI